MRARLTGLMLAAMLAACGPDQPESYPERLSDWQLMEVSEQPGEGRKLVLAGDVVPYELATPLFSDYAQKLVPSAFPTPPPGIGRMSPWSSRRAPSSARRSTIRATRTGRCS